MVNPGKAPKTEPLDYAFEIGQRLRCEWREGDLRDCEVIERRTSAGGAVQYGGFLGMLAFVGVPLA